MKRKQTIDAEQAELQPIRVKIDIKSDLRKRPYGLLEGAGLSTRGLSPREAWSEWNEYRKAERERQKKEKGKRGKEKTLRRGNVISSVAPQKALPQKTVAALPAPTVSPIRSDGVKIPELNKSQIQQANANSHFDRGTGSEREYNSYAARIMAMDISDGKKQQLLDELHKRWSKMLSYQAQWVPWTVAGPARYNSKRLDKGDKVLQTGAEISDWFDRVEKSVRNSKRQYEDNSASEAKRAEEYFKRFESGYIFRNPTSTMVARALEGVAVHDAKRYTELYEEYDKKYHFRKNTSAAKIYEEIKAGNFNGGKKTAEKLHETENLNAYRKKIDAGERVFMKFTTRPKQQLVYALKKRGWHWNSNEQAWSVPVSKYDEEFVKGIDERYKKYL